MDDRKEEVISLLNKHIGNAFTAPFKKTSTMSITHDETVVVFSTEVYNKLKGLLLEIKAHSNS